MDNNSTPDVVHNTDNTDSSSVVATPIIDIDPTAVMESNRQPPMTPEAQQDLVDMLMTVEDNDDMPSLYEASFTESDIENIAIAPNLDAQIPISQHTQQNNGVRSESSSQPPFSTPSPPPSSSSPHPQRNNRRARVEDDDDEDRDRRHPSQRVGTNGQPSTSHAPPNSLFGSFFHSFRDTGAVGLGLGTGFFNRTTNPNLSHNSSIPSTNSNDSNINPTPGAFTSSSPSQNQGPPQNASGAANSQAPVHVLDYELSIVMDGSRPQPAQRPQNQAPDPNAERQTGGNTPTDTPPGPTVAGAAGAPPNISFNPPIPLGNLATLLGIPFPLPGVGFAFPPLPEEKEDPERARKLVDGLDEVPVGLVRRLERVGTGGGGMGQDESKGGDVGCAVCWDRLLSEEVEQHHPLEEPHENRGGSESMVVDEEAGEGMKEEPKYPKLVALPCAHIFHAECLMPWFSRPRHTTCPTCRFNIDPDNLTYVSARQRRQEQRRSASDNEDDNEPSEGTPGDRPMDVASATSTATETGGQPQDQHDGNPVVDLGDGFAGIIQMLNAQGQLQQPPTATAADGNGAVPSGAEPQGQEPPPPIMPIPMPFEGAGNFLPAAFAVGQLPMPMGVPFMLPLGNAQGMPTPWRMAGPLHMATGGGARTNATNVGASGAGTGAGNASATPATTLNAPSSDGTTNAPQPQPPHQPHVIADVIRISVDMVFDGRPMRWATNHQGHADNSALPAGGNPPHNATREQAMDTNGDHDFDDEPPALLSREEIEEQDRPFRELLDRIRRTRQNHPNDRTAPTPTANTDSEQPAPQTQPVEPRPQPHGPPVYSLEDIHVAGTGRSFEEAFSQALSRLHNRMGQPRQDGQNPQPTDAAAPNENAPLPPLPPQPTQVGAQPGAQPGGRPPVQPPWHFMPVPMPFMDYGISMPAPEGPKRSWAPPPPPGLTLRQRIERREWEAGLRCHDVSCGLGPSDEDPLGDDVSETLRKGQQVSIMRNEEDGEGVRTPVCGHRFHGMCLVSAERVALRGAEAIANKAGSIEVSCPVCRGAGYVTKDQWDEGVLALQ